MKARAAAFASLLVMVFAFLPSGAHASGPQSLGPLGTAYKTGVAPSAPTTQDVSPARIRGNLLYHGGPILKQSTTHAMMALVDYPDQRDWLMEDFEDRIGPAIEEFVRWSSPDLQFARFVTEDTEINGQPVSAGDKVGLFYCSANRDDAVFDEPARFNLQRSPNPHLGFGGGGPHFCLGNQLAKAELRNLFRELLTRLKTVEFGEPDLLYSSFVHGVKRLPAFVQ